MGMPMEPQAAFNVVTGIAGFLGGWWLKVLWSEVKGLQQTDKELADKVASIEVLVAGRYISREEFNGVVNRLFEKLDHIQNTVAGKADR
jgi:hypothetical protein